MNIICLGPRLWLSGGGRAFGRSAVGLRRRSRGWRRRWRIEDVSAQELKAGLKGRTFESTRRHGKYLFVELDDGYWLVLHFGMTGHLKYFKDMEKDPPYDRLLITFC